MKNEALSNIKSALTPKVTLEACQDVEDGIVATVKHEYCFDFPIAKVINVKADKDGEILEAIGLF